MYIYIYIYVHLERATACAEGSWTPVATASAARDPRPALRAPRRRPLCPQLPVVSPPGCWKTCALKYKCK